ncbi:hypothetical protein IQ270_20515 [Microcoleus sp. LEGE 07076]|uniref:hypothetical protein n=1 Tax=Microcoleus sp. LEGE 07076 TaxID=915322 RepID=UPI00187F7A0F|nr:hypothetical protein [Microcoleus sp. LEGE 07076]MBE9186974.1 hypothetical protein [Microcoleus sp. LEGE 07076]
MQITLTIPARLEQQLLEKASQLNLPLETLILQSLRQLFQEDEEELSKEDILNSLRIALQEVEDGQVHPIAELWDGIDV